MNKTIITTVLDPDIKQSLSQYSKKTYIPYSKIIEYAVNHFKSKMDDSGNFRLLYNEFDRIKTQSFTCSVMDDINKMLIMYADKLGISKRMLIREIITGYVKDKL